MDTLLNCTDCPRLAGFLAGVRGSRPDYHARPVPAFGDPRARLLIVGLAPGMHGANRTGRPFTGDYAGILLYETLHAFGFGSQPVSQAADDDLRLSDCRITNAVKCLPPENKPEPAEIRTCNHYLVTELKASPEVRVDPGARAGGAQGRADGTGPQAVGAGFRPWRASCAAPHDLAPSGSGGRILIDSYHCSRYNTQTRRLTSADFQDVFRKIRKELDAA
jgi:uracil-DNA glycosylase family 4